MPWMVGYVLCAASFHATAQTSVCSPQQQSDIAASYERFRSASRAGDLPQVKTLSSRAVLAEITGFEKSAPDAAALARQMGAVMPLWSEARDIRCQSSGQRARLLLRTDAVDRDSKKTISITTIVMFELGSGTNWLVGEKAMTNPYAAQSVESLLQHEKLRLP